MIGLCIARFHLRSFERVATIKAYAKGPDILNGRLSAVGQRQIKRTRMVAIRTLWISIDLCAISICQESTLRPMLLKNQIMA